MEMKFKRDIGALDEIFVFIDNFIDDNEFDEALAFSTRLVVEEIFTNLVRHNAGGLEHISIFLDADEQCVTIRLQDFNVDPVEIPKEVPVGLDKPLSERVPGGLGIHLVKSLVDKLTYEYRDRTLTVTAIKCLGGA